ncbi:MAG: Fe-S cluster assembly sulfur transfer protein SufU [Candidatus Gracilibacteria bacterium]
MENLRELYQQVILDHNKDPKNFGDLEHCTHHAEGRNPVCGDHYIVKMLIEDTLIKDIHYQGSGCAISKSSGSLMTSMLKGKTEKEALELFDVFQKLVTSSIESEVDKEKLGKLSVFAGVREFPARVKCASLVWHAMKAAIERGRDVTTE